MVGSRKRNFNYFFLVGLLISCHNLWSTPLNTSMVSINTNENWYCLQEYGVFLKVNNGYLKPEEALSQLDSFSSWNKISNITTANDLWIYFEIYNGTKNEETIYLNGQHTDFVELYELKDSKPLLISRSGYLIPYQDRPVSDWGTLVKSTILPKSKSCYLVRYKSITNNSKQLLDYLTTPCMKVFTSRGYFETYSLPMPLLYFFYGAIVIMALYNLGISISTLYREYILFSVYNIFTVITALSICNQEFETGYFQTLDFARNLRYIPGALVCPAYLWFAIQYLGVKNWSLKVYNKLKVISLSYTLVILLLLISKFTMAFIVFTIITGVAFFIVLVSTLLLSKTNKSARFFLVGIISISCTTILQLGSLYNIITTTQMSVGIMLLLIIEMVVFSLAVAYKLKASRKAIVELESQNQVQENLLKRKDSDQQKLKTEVDEKSRVVVTSSLQLVNLSERLAGLEDFIQNSDETNPKDITKSALKEIKKIKVFENDWNTFKKSFEDVHPDFFTIIEKYHPELSANDRRICAFLKMNFSNREIALTLNVTKKAVEQAKRRMRKKILKAVKAVM